MRHWLYWLPIILFITGCESGTSTPPEQAQDAAKEMVAPAQAPEPEKPVDPYAHMTLHSVKDDPMFVIDAIKGAIGDRGIKINGISHIGDMLDRTAEAVGATKKVFKEAQAINFCSSTLSRATMEADPHNIAFCPYVIAIYETMDEPGTVYITYRKPLLVGTEESRAALKAVGDLLDGIVEDAIR
jgi:hypothetical protein